LQACSIAAAVLVTGFAPCSIRRFLSQNKCRFFHAIEFQTRRTRACGSRDLFFR
jgi:hypothetical protein